MIKERVSRYIPYLEQNKAEIQVKQSSIATQNRRRRQRWLPRRSALVVEVDRLAPQICILWDKNQGGRGMVCWDVAAVRAKSFGDWCANEAESTDTAGAIAARRFRAAVSVSGSDAVAPAVSSAPRTTAGVHRGMAGSAAVPRASTAASTSAGKHFRGPIGTGAGEWRLVWPCVLSRRRASAHSTTRHVLALSRSDAARFGV